MSEKISQMTDGSPAQSGDTIPVVRGGANFRVSAASIAALAGGGGGGVLGKWPGNIISSNAAGYTGAGGSITTAGNQGMDIQQVSGQPETIQPPTATTPLGIQMMSPSFNAATGLIDLSQNLTLGLLEDWLMRFKNCGHHSVSVFHRSDGLC